MAILSHEDFMSRLKAHIGDDTGDEAMSLIEDFTDTYNDLEARANSATDSDWEKKYNELDQSWREKYKARFFDGDAQTSPEAVISDQKADVKDDGEVKDFTDLFVEREG